MGDFAEEFIAIELWKIDRKYINMEVVGGEHAISLPEIIPKFSNGDFEKLLTNIFEVLRPMIGTIYSQRIVNQIGKKFAVSVLYAQ